MTLDEFKTNPDAQRKFYIFAGTLTLAVLWLLLGGTAKTAFVRTTARRPPPVATYVPAPAPRPVAAPVVPAPPPSPEQVAEAQLATLAGIWAGGVPVKNIGLCEIRLEVRPGEGKASFSGYSTFTCSNANALRFRPGQRTTPANAAEWLEDVKPVSAILSGGIKNGSIDLVQEKAIGANRAGCNIVRLVLTPFAEQMAVNWKEGPVNGNDNPAAPACSGGDLVMNRLKR